MRRRELRQEFNVPVSRQPHLTPKGVSICAGPMAIKHATAAWLSRAACKVD